MWLAGWDSGCTGCIATTTSSPTFWPDEPGWLRTRGSSHCGSATTSPSHRAGNPPRLEALVALTYLAAVTTRVRLGVGLIVLPQRQPVLLAKQLMSVDVLSRGRLTVAVGAGYVEPELQAMGVSLAERGARTDEHLAAMRTMTGSGKPHPGGVRPVPRRVGRG